MEDRVYDLVVEQNEIGWRSIILDLIRSDQMDPWDVDVSKLTQRYIERLKQLQSADLKIGGKVLLAAAILLKIKSTRLVGDDLNEFDRLLQSAEMTEAEFYEQLEGELRSAQEIPKEELFQLIPRTPQPRTRKVNVLDLVKALEKALEVRHRKLLRAGVELPVVLPGKPLDIGLAIKQLYFRIREHYIHNSGALTFSMLAADKGRKDKVYTFMPLLYLSNQRKVDLVQREQFGEITIRLP